MKKTLGNLFRFILFFGVGFTILYLVYQNNNKSYQEQCQLDGIPLDQCSLLDKVFTDFAGADFFWLFMMVFAFMLSNVSRAMRWNMLIEPLGYKPKLLNSFNIVMLGYFANLGLPRMGEVVRAAALARYEGINAEKVMGTVVADRVMDVIMLVIMIALGFFFEFDVIWGWLSENMKGSEGSGSIFSNPWIIGVLGIGLIAFLILIVFWRQIKALSIVEKSVQIIKGFWEGLISVRKISQPWIFVFHSIFIWSMYYIMFYFCFLSYEPTSVLAPATALVVFVFGAFGIVIPSPGGMGTFHFLVVAALSLKGINDADAFSFANINFFTITIFASVFFGVLALILLPLTNPTRPK